MAANPHFESQSATDAESVNWRDGELALPDPFVLESGHVVNDARLAWQCVGPEDAPLVIVLGGISAHRRVCAIDGRGWWQEQCGEGKALDTRRYRLLGIDWLGGCDASTGPLDAGQINADQINAGQKTGEFPVISTSDQARALLLLLNRLGIRRVHLLVGASYGGNVAQHLAALLGQRLRHLVLLSAAHRPSQFGLAIRHLQRTILDLGGDTDGTQALALARSLAVLGYRTPEGIEQRFGLDGTEHDVLNWLDHHGRKFVQRFNSHAYRCLGRSLDTHVIDPSAIYAPTTLFAVREDLTVPISLVREYAERAGEDCELVEISSIYGHDAFLKEESRVSTVLEHALKVKA